MMRLNNKGFAITSIIYSMLVLFLALVLLIMSNLASRKVVFDKQKGEILNKLNGEATTTGACNIEINHQYTYNYTGSSQIFTVPCSGNYKVELWGAQGGGDGGGSEGGYTSGIIYLNANDNYYIYVGGNGLEVKYNSSGVLGGYNGGGGGTLMGQTTQIDRIWGSGGGATDIRLIDGIWNDSSSLASRIMVAAGGGGTYTDSNTTKFIGTKGYGGGINGIGANIIQTSHSFVWGKNSIGATQTAGGYCLAGSSTGGDNVHVAIGSLGIGGSITNGNSAGGGGGYYGGGGSAHVQNASGGSSYISGHKGCVAIISNSNTSPKPGCADGTTNTDCSYHYSNKVFTDTTIKAGDEPIPSHSGIGTILGNSGNGYAKITYLGN